MSDVSDHPLAALKAVLDRARSGAGHEHCDMCAAAIGVEHRHVVDLDARTLRCLCTPCYLLFSDAAAAGGRYRQVGDRHRRLGDLTIDQRDWDALQIPVSLAFFFHNSSLGRIVAFYPGPGGATESLLPLDAWDALVARHATLAELEPDVEAILVRRTDTGVVCYVVPIDACYRLVGALRMHWSGFDGGVEAHLEIDAFFASLRESIRG
jgi:Family of unknown function (DUF5947)